MLKRIKYLDVIKGIAILLVVLGHCIQCSDADFAQNILFKYIYSFHMPLFMCVSGFLYYNKQLSKDVIIKRGKQLLIPFFVWPLVRPLLALRLPSLNIYPQIILHPDNGGLWFLWVLFFISLLFLAFYSLATRYSLNQEIVMASVAILLCGIELVTNFRLLGFHFISWYFLFFSLGFFMRKYMAVCTKLCK